MVNARKTAQNALIKIFDGAYSNLVMKEIFSNENISSTDKSFINSLVIGVTERKLTLDYIIEKASGRKIEKISKEALFPLRLGVYQILYMDKVPDSAAVNESVKLVKSGKKPFLSGFVNAVLRGILRNEGGFLPTECRTEAELSIVYSCGTDIVTRLAAEYGFKETQAVLENSFHIPPLVAKVNNLKISDDDFIEQMKKQSVNVKQTEFSHMFFLDGMTNIGNCEAFKKGWFHIQDLSSAAVAFFADCRSGERVLDICAAPGGKTFTAAEIMENNGEIIAADIHPHRVKLIDDGKKRLGLTCVKTAVSDASVFNEGFGKFDRVICDVPCSGIGVVSRKPEIKYKKTDDFSALPGIQLSILKNAARYVKSGGTLIYSTCTLFKEENEQVVDEFLSFTPEFTLECRKTVIPDETHDGFFMAKMINNSL